MPDLKIETVQDYPRPPALEPVPQRIRILLGGHLAAETTRAFRVLETHHAPTYYLPPEDVRADPAAARGQSVCEWKGVATYWDVTLGVVTASRAAWSYAKPADRFAPLAGYFAFYAASMEACFIGTHRVTPQPGDFYGGWVTDNLRGRIKGAPGTQHW